MNCLHCNAKFHVCSNCCTDYDWENEYCCEECWKESEEYKNIINDFKEFTDGLSKTQIKYFQKEFIERDAHDFEFEFLKILEKEENEN